MSVSRGAIVAGQGAPRKSYIAMRNYQGDIFTYATSNVNFVTNGSLTPYDSSYSNVCLQGNFLTETGHRLYPGTHPGVSTMMVSVMDYSALSNGATVKGFIDPTSFAFTPQTSDRSYQIMSAGANPNPGGNGVPQNSFPSDQGPPVFTHGDIKADGNQYIGGHVSTMGNMMVAGNTTIQNKLYLSESIIGTASMSNASNVGGLKKLTISNNAVTSNSAVLLTYTGQNNVGVLSAENIGASTFTIVSNNISDGSGVRYLIIN